MDHRAGHVCESRGGGLAQLFPTLNNWKEKGVVSKIMSIINLPIIFFLAITVPVVELVQPEEVASAPEPTPMPDVGTPPPPPPAVEPAAKEPPPDDDEVQAVWNRYLFCIQCFLMPVFVVFGVRGTS